MSITEGARRVLHAYRTLLRATDRRVTRVSGNPLWRDEVRAAFRAPVPPGGLDAALVRAEDLAFLVDRVNAHKDLLLSYGISTDKEAETRQRVADTARRVGLSIRPGAYDGNPQV